MANPLRGEIDIELGGETLTLRPSFDAICQVESATGKHLAELAAEMASGRVGLRQAAVIVTACANAADPDKRLNESQVGPKLMGRLPSVWRQLTGLIMTVCNEGPSEGNAAAPSDPSA